LQVTESNVSENDIVTGVATDEKADSNKKYVDFGDIHNKNLDQIRSMAKEYGYSVQFREYDQQYIFTKYQDSISYSFGAIVKTGTSEIIGLKMILPMDSYNTAKDYFSRYDYFTECYGGDNYDAFIALYPINGKQSYLLADVHEGDYEPF